MQEINNNTVIKNISTDQSEILKNIMQLHNNNEPFECDITASELKFYKKNKKTKYDIPVPKILMDVYPQSDNIIKITPFQKLPLEDNSISSVVADLPFVISPKTSNSKKNPKEGSNLISNRFSSFYPADELFENIYWWIKECYRVLKDDGICVWKMESTVSGGRECWSVPFSFMVADRLGFYVIDEFVLEAKTRIVATSHFKNGQKHARKYTSTFWVFKKDRKKAEVNSCFKWLKQCEEQDLEGKVWIEPKEMKRLGLDPKQTVKQKELTYYDKIKAEAINKNFNWERQSHSENITKEPLKVEEPKDNNVNVETSLKTDKQSTKKNKKKTTIIQLTLTNDFINEWLSYDDIIKKYPKISKSSLSQCVNGKTQSAGGFKWNKKENVEEITC